METSLRDKYCIVGVGETEYSRGSGRTTRALGAEAIRNAMHDAGLAPDQVDGMLSYHGGDSTPSTSIMYDLGLRPNFYMDCSGGGFQHRGPGGLGHGRHRNRHGRHRRCFPFHERLLQHPHRGNRRQGVRADNGFGPDETALRHDQRRAAVLLYLHPPHDGVRRHQRAPGSNQGGPQQSRQQQSQGT